MSNLTQTKEFYNRLVNVHSEIAMLQDDIKQIKEEFEEKLPEENFADVNKVAKLDATQKLGQAVDKAEVFIETAGALKG